MKINDVEEKLPITINVMKDEKTMQLYTASVKPYEDGLLVLPIRYNNKLIGFSAPGLMISVDVRSGAIVNRFEPAMISSVRYQGRMFHWIRCVVEGRKINRRGDFRIPITLHGLANIAGTKIEEKVKINDLSASGFSFICRDTIFPEAAPGANIILRFNDQETGKVITLNGKVVRIKKTGQTQNKVVGCRLEHRSDTLAAYVNHLQLRRVSAESGEDRAKDRQGFLNTKKNSDDDDYAKTILSEP